MVKIASIIITFITIISVIIINSSLTNWPFWRTTSETWCCTWRSLPNRLPSTSRKSEVDLLSSASWRRKCSPVPNSQSIILHQAQSTPSPNLQGNQRAQNFLAWRWTYKIVMAVDRSGKKSILGFLYFRHDYPSALKPERPSASRPYSCVLRQTLTLHTELLLLLFSAKLLFLLSILKWLPLFYFLLKITITVFIFSFHKFFSVLEGEHKYRVPNKYRPSSGPLCGSVSGFYFLRFTRTVTYIPTHILLYSNPSIFLS